MARMSIALHLRCVADRLTRIPKKEAIAITLKRPSLHKRPLAQPPACMLTELLVNDRRRRSGNEPGCSKSSNRRHRRLDKTIK